VWCSRLIRIISKSSDRAFVRKDYVTLYDTTSSLQESLFLGLLLLSYSFSYLLFKVYYNQYYKFVSSPKYIELLL